MTVPQETRITPGGFTCISLAATLSGRKEVFAVEHVIAFIISLLAGITCNYICKWLDEENT